MTTDNAPALSELEALEAQLSGADKAHDPYARTERRFMAVTKVLETTYMPKHALDRAQIDTDSPEFKAAYPSGLPCLHIALEGIDVTFTGVPDNMLHLYIPVMGDRPEQYGKPKGRRSRAHITSEAFESCWKLRPYGKENQAKLIGQKAEWGQHLGDADIDGDKREWAWDIPRKSLPLSFSYEGPVREINIAPRADSGPSGAATAGVAEMSEDEAVLAVLAAVIGLEDTDAVNACARVLEIPGLPGDYNQAAVEGRIFQFLGKKGLILSEEGKVVYGPQAPQAVAA